MSGPKKSLLWETIETIAVALILTLVIRHFIVESFVVRGSSMEPTLHDGQRLLVSKFSFRFFEPERGDIIIFRSPIDPRDDLIKRVIAVPGEKIEVARGQAYVQGQPLAEPYISSPDNSMVLPLVVPEGKLFVMGDNRPNSEDSRFFGFIPQTSIKGKAVVVWWPPTEFHLLR